MCIGFIFLKQIASVESCRLVDIKHICVIIKDDDSLIVNFFFGDLVLCIYK